MTSSYSESFILSLKHCSRGAMGKLFCSWVTWPDLVTWPHMALGRNFHKSCGKMGGKVDENPAALRAAVFSLSSKNLRGGRSNPPSRARVKMRGNTSRGLTNRGVIACVDTVGHQRRMTNMPVEHAAACCASPTPWTAPVAEGQRGQCPTNLPQNRGQARLPPHVTLVPPPGSSLQVPLPVNVSAMWCGPLSHSVPEEEWTSQRQLQDTSQLSHQVSRGMVPPERGLNGHIDGHNPWQNTLPQGATRRHIPELHDRRKSFQPISNAHGFAQSTPTVCETSRWHKALLAGTQDQEGRGRQYFRWHKNKHNECDRLSELAPWFVPSVAVRPGKQFWLWLRSLESCIGKHIKNTFFKHVNCWPGIKVGNCTSRLKFPQKMSFGHRALCWHRRQRTQGVQYVAGVWGTLVCALSYRDPSLVSWLHTREIWPISPHV